MIDFAEYQLFDSNWVLSDDLFSKKSKFTLKPYGEGPAMELAQWLPEGAKPR